MPRIAGVDVPAKKKIGFSLRYIYGVGPTLAKKICTAVGVDENKRAEQLSEAEIAHIREYIETNYEVEGDLRREIQGNVKVLKDLGSYRGARHIRHLPCRGQRTRTNARVAKGRPRVAIAGKKKAPTAK